MLYSIIVVLCVVSLLFIACSFGLALQLREARLRINSLFEEKAKALEDADHYAELAQNPLGPLFAQSETPLIISFDAKGKITNVSQTVLQKFGYTKNQLIGHPIVGCILPKIQKKNDDIVYRLFKNPTLFIDTETETQTRSGEKIWISWKSIRCCSR